MIYLNLKSNTLMTDFSCNPTPKDVLEARQKTQLGQCKPGQCAICQKELAQRHMSFGGLFKMPVHYCDKATELLEAAEQLEADQMRANALAQEIKRWQDDCPPLYKKIKPASRVNYPKIDWRAYDIAMEWNPEGGEGLVMTGDSGAGKSTTLWHLMLKLTRGRKQWEVYSGGRLSRCYFSELKGGSVERLAYELSSVEVLAFDDFGKGLITEGLGALLFDVINTRTEQGLPIVMTTRFTSKSLPDRFRDDPTKGHDIARRLNDYCQVQIFRTNEQ